MEYALPRTRERYRERELKEREEGWRREEEREEGMGGGREMSAVAACKYTAVTIHSLQSTLINCLSE